MITGIGNDGHLRGSLGTFAPVPGEPGPIAGVSHGILSGDSQEHVGCDGTDGLGDLGVDGGDVFPSGTACWGTTLEPGGLILLFPRKSGMTQSLG